MDTSDWPLSAALDRHLRRLGHLVGLAERDGRESPWYAVYNHALTFMAARNETDDNPLYVWPQCSLFAKDLDEVEEADTKSEPESAGELEIFIVIVFGLS